MSCDICAYPFYVVGVRHRAKTDESCSEFACEEKCVAGSNMCSKHTRQRVKVTCDKCGNAACRMCYTKYWVSQVVATPRCMHCLVDFTKEFLVECDPDSRVSRFTKKFVNGELVDQLGEALVQNEAARIDEHSAALIRVEAIARLTSENKELRQQIARTKEQIYRNAQNIERLKHGQEVQDYSEDSAAETAGEEEKKPVRTAESKPRTILKCPAEACNGFIMQNWKCMSCKSSMCRKCHELTSTGDAGDKDTSEHECDPERAR